VSRERRRVEEVAPPQLGRVDAELGGGQVEHALQVGGGLRAARAPERAHRRGVGERHRAVESDLRDVVDALAHHEGGAERERAAEARVGARVADDPRPQAGDPPFPGEAQLVVGDLAAPVGHRDEVLRAGLDPAHRPPERARHADRHRVLGQHAGLAAEAAADVRGDHADALGVEAEDLRRLAAEAVRHLGGDPDGQLVVAALVAARQHRDRVALQGEHRHPLVDHPGADDDLGVGQRVLGVLGCAALACGEVVAALELRGGPVVERGLHVGDGGQRVVVHLHQLDGVDRGGLRLPDDHGHGLAHEADAVGGQRRARQLRVEHEQAVVSGQVEVGGRVDGDDARRRGGRGGVDPGDPAVGQRGADEGEVQQAGQREVADVGARPGDQVAVLHAADGGTQDRSRHVSSLRLSGTK
jgi:hypothetical protein